MKSSKTIICSVVAIVLVCTIAITSCTHKSKDDLYPTVSFSKDVIPIFHSSCAINSGCHEGASNTNDYIDFTDTAAYNTIIDKGLVNTSHPNASLLYYEISAGLMPKEPYSSLPDIQVNLILNWIKQGAKNN